MIQVDDFYLLENVGRRFDFYGDWKPLRVNRYVGYHFLEGGGLQVPLVRGDVLGTYGPNGAELELVYDDNNASELRNVGYPVLQAFLESRNGACPGMLQKSGMDEEHGEFLLEARFARKRDGMVVELGYGDRITIGDASFQYVFSDSMFPLGEKAVKSIGDHLTIIPELTPGKVSGPVADVMEAILGLSPQQYIIYKTLLMEMISRLDVELGERYAETGGHREERGVSCINVGSDAFKIFMERIEIERVQKCVANSETAMDLFAYISRADEGVKEFAAKRFLDPFWELKK